MTVHLRQIVTPWDVEADDDEGIDYDKLIDRFGSQRISPELIARMERLTGKKGKTSTHPRRSISAGGVVRVAVPVSARACGDGDRLRIRLESKETRACCFTCARGDALLTRVPRSSTPMAAAGDLLLSP